MLECLYELDKSLAVGRKRVRDFAPLVFLVEQAGLHESSRMFGNSFNVAVERLGNFFQSDTVIFTNQP